MPRFAVDPDNPELEGAATSGEVSVILVNTGSAGTGPRLHQHPYPETFVLVVGDVHFWVGDDDFIATGPSFQVAPALTPHRYEVVGSSHVQMVDVHASPRFLTEWLE